MKTKKKAVALALALGLAAAGNMAVYGAGTVDLTGGVDADGKAESVLTGTINITSIKVEVPIKASFDIDPNVTATAGTRVVIDTADATKHTNQITAQASNYTITNKSKVPLKVSITNIETKSKDGSSAGPALVNTMNGLTGTNILFAVREKSETISYPAAASAGSEPWMMTTISAGSPYFVKGSTASTLAATGVADGSDELTMLLYGATGSGWRNGEGFQVIPTFLVETTS